MILSKHFFVEIFAIVKNNYYFCNMKKILTTVLLALSFVTTAFAQSKEAEVMQKAISVNDWFMRQWPDPKKDTFVRNKVRPSSLWTRAVYYEGLMALNAVQPEQRYMDYTLEWCNHHNWTPRNGTKTHDADDYCCSQTYIDMYRMGAEGATLQYVIENMEKTIARGGGSNADWFWIDAIQMGMPVLMKLAKTTGDKRYADKAWSMYSCTRDTIDGGMRNPKNGLWWRDKDFNPPFTTPNGKECYWSRGDGWVAAALVRVMDEMKPTDEHYDVYLNDLKTLLEGLVPLQREDGFWNCSLADPQDFGGPEVTGTSLFLYGMAWCVRHGYLPAEKYGPIMQRAWQAMASCVHPDGMLGWQQGTGKEPKDSQPILSDKLPDFDDYGVGCFLLGATEYYKLIVGNPQFNAKNTTKPGLRWWWLGSAVTPEGLRYNMEQMASRGIGTLEITPLYGVQGNDQNNIPFLSPRWMEMLKVCQNEGERLGIQIDMNCGTGWPFGGPEVPIDEAACKLIVVDSIMPKSAMPVTLPAPAKEVKFAKLITQKTFKTKQKDMVRVIALYQSRTRQKVKRAAPGGEGWVIDHFDRDAVKHYLDRFTKAFAQAGAKYPATFFNDSYEVYEADWTPTLLDEFKARRGYDLLSKLQEFVDGNPDVISDYRETLSDLLLENFTHQWVDWSHSHGVQVRNQAHGSPANLIDVYAAVDIPEIEGFGLSEFGIKGLRTDAGYTKKNFSDLSMLKYAPSAAHVMGKPLASCETFTWLTEHFRTSLSQMKPDLDLLFCSGVNRMMFHGAAYSPQDDPWPGWRFYASVDMSPTNSIWRDASELTEYINYCQERLQQGQPDNDFLVLLPVRNLWHDNAGKRLLQFDIHKMDKVAPRFISSVLKIDSLGYDCDYISERLLLGTTYVDGMLQTAAGTRYKALIIPGSETIITKPLRKHLDMLKKQGAHIIYNIEASEMAKVARPETMKTLYHLNMIRRNTTMAGNEKPSYRYFIANLTPNDISKSVSLSVTETPLNLILRSGESCFVDVDGNGTPLLTYPLAARQGDYTLLKDITDQPWTLSFTESVPAVSDTIALSRLQTWEEMDNADIRELMGTGVYETSFDVTLPLASGYRLDLGDVRESARVYLNDKYVGTAWCVPMTLDIPADALNNGKNKIRIEVTNLPANRIAAYDRRGIQWRKFNEINVVDLNYKKDLYDQWAPVASGLNSNVKILYKK